MKKNTVDVPKNDGVVDEAVSAPSLFEEIDRRLQGQRLTPAHRRIVQILLENASNIGFLSSMELAQLADVSQPSVTRFAAALGFDGFSDMRKALRDYSGNTNTLTPGAENKYQAAAIAESANLASLIESFSDLKQINEIGSLLAFSKPLVVMGFRASAGLAEHFSYFAAKVHTDVRCISQGGSLAEDMIDQAVNAGSKCVLAFAMPLYPREAIRALQYAKDSGLKVIVVADPTFAVKNNFVDYFVPARIHSGLVFDSSACASVLVSILLNSLCDAMPKHSEARLESADQSSKRRKVFLG